MTYDLTAHNTLQGKIPTELTRLGNLEKLYIQNNRMDGTFPTEFSNMNELRVFDATTNHFIGNMDESFCQRPSSWVEMEVLDADCMEDTLSCSCCTRCCDENSYCCDMGTNECAQA